MWQWILLILVIVAVVLLLIFVGYYNRVKVMGNRVDNSWSQIDVQLKKRNDLVPNLVETVKGYATHEKGIMTDVTDAHKAMLGAQTIAEKAEASGVLTNALRGLLALAENYPNLKANENFRLLQEQLEGIENKIAYARQFYNDSVLEYNNLITTIPGMWFAGMMGRTQQKEYFKVTEAERQVPKVSFQ